MILNIKTNFYQIFKLIFLLLITYTPNLNSHNLFNGGCSEHCGQKVEEINNQNILENFNDQIKIESKNILNNVNDQIKIESKNSCLNKSLCRG